MKRLPTLLLLIALTLLAAAPAQAEFGLKDLDAAISAQGGEPGIGAGSHPFAVTTTLATLTEPNPELGYEYPDGSVEDLRVATAAGLVGNPTAVPRCSSADFLTILPSGAVGDCADSTALGVVTSTIEEPTEDGTFTSAIYNLKPPPGVAARIGFWTLIVPLTVDFRVNPAAPHNVIVSVNGIPQVVPFYSSKVTLWGVPADPAHNSERGRCAGKEGGQTCPASIPEKPFITLPTSCEGPLPMTFEADSWEGETFKRTVFAHDGSSPPNTVGPSGCEELEFKPEVIAEPSTHSAQSATGLDFAVSFEDEGLTDPDGVAQSTMKKAVVDLPPGINLNPAAATGLASCSIADYERESIASEAGEGCPQASKIGEVEVETPLLEGELLQGSLFVAAQDDNLVRSRFAFYMVIRDLELGILVKLPGKVEPDERTGQLKTTFGEAPYEVPQFPFASARFHFRAGPRAPLVTPQTCGEYVGSAVLTPWSGGAARTIPIPVRIDSGIGGARCPASPPPFDPELQAGTLNNSAGSYSPLYLRLSLPDGQQDLTRIDSILPPGLSGKIAGIPLCSDTALNDAAAKSGRAELGSPSCPSASEIGSVLAGAGVGGSLTYVSGKIYLAGPFGDAPLSVAVVTPAVAGPFDVGTVVTREALNLDPTTAEVTVDGARSQPIPHILAGIPLQLRDLRVKIDRPNFTLNATSCTPSSIRANLFGSFADPFSSADDVSVTRSDRYQAASCASLPFKPKLSLRLKGGTKRSGHPALRAVLTPRPGDANIGRSVVSLPPTEFIDNAHIQNPCTRVQFNAGACPQGSILGNARAVSPLLDAPLEGPIYFRSNGGERLLPDIVVDLRGQFHIVLVGWVDSKKGRIRTRFVNVPDAPVTKFTLSLFGGKRGLLVNSTNLCAKKRRAGIQLTGQNGRPYNTQPVIATSCNASAKTPRP
jgi:hypothetical protein